MYEAQGEAMKINFLNIENQICTSRESKRDEYVGIRDRARRLLPGFVTNTHTRDFCKYKNLFIVVPAEYLGYSAKKN
jgi:hypothetical protein